METPFQFKMSLDEWRHNLRDIDFWLKGYLNNLAYRDLEDKLFEYPCVQWNVGVGPTCCFTRAISSIAEDVNIRRRGPFDQVIEVDMSVIKVDMKLAALAELGTNFSIDEKLAIKVAEQLGLLDQDYSRPKAGDAKLQHNTYSDREGKPEKQVAGDRDQQRKLDEQKKRRIVAWDPELRYYSYGLEVASETSLPEDLAASIAEKLSRKRFLLLVENLDEPIKPIKLDAFTEDLSFLPPPGWNKSKWIITPTSKDIYDRSKPDYDCVVSSFGADEILILTLHSLHQAAKYITNAIAYKEEHCWHLVAIRCFLYATMLLIPHCSSPPGDGDQGSSDPPPDITSDELIRQWATQGILTTVDQETMDEGMGRYHRKYNDIYKVGNVILEAFAEHSLLQQPFSPATKADEAMKSAANFLAWHNLIAERHTVDELCEDKNHPGLERMQLISHMGNQNQGWHLSRELLCQGASTPTSLIIRHCSEQSRLFLKHNSNHFLAKFPYLLVLDLSYTPLESLPPSIFCLQKLKLLSLRGSYNLRNPFSFPETEITPAGNKSRRKLNLLYLDLSYSNISTFQHDFFYSTPNLQELLLVKCSNLEELPPSIAALSSLTRLELIDNEKLLSLPGSLKEIILDGHPTLRSFTLIGAPHIGRLSFHGCGKLESVDIKEVDALEELDLSATATKELSADIPNLPQLRKLLFMGVPSLRRFPWHELQRLPDVFCLDHCSNSTVNHFNPQAAQVCINDSRLLYSFNERTRDLVRGGQILKCFYVRVTSCKATARKMQDEKDMVSTSKLQISISTYADVNSRYLTDGVHMVPMDDIRPVRETERHVEISATELYPHGLKHLLEVTKSISMLDDSHVSCLNDLSRYLNELEDCMLRRCDQIVDVFKTMDTIYLGRHMKNACVSHLRRLINFSRTPNGVGDFDALKHLVLEHCPRLERVVPNECELPSLVTLDILFCYNLKEIFYDNNHYGSFNLPCLRRMHLQELPLLKHLRDDDAILTAPMWEELHVRGCWSLCRLPRLEEQPGKAVKVSGVWGWWTKLRWDYRHKAAHRSCYEPRLPRASASFRERVVPKSYLR